MKAHPLLSLLLPVIEACCTPGAAVDTDTKEPGFWEVCYEVTGDVESYAGECEEPEKIIWELPVKLAIDEAYPNPEAVLKAVRVWNAWLGTDVFYVTPVDPDVTVVFEQGSVLSPAGMAVHHKAGDRVVFEVTLYGDAASRVSIIVHELGHVMGLAHDTGRHRSIMDPGGDWYMPWLTRKDCKALRELYDLAQEDCNH